MDRGGGDIDRFIELLLLHFSSEGDVGVRPVEYERDRFLFVFLFFSDAKYDSSSLYVLFCCLEEIKGCEIVESETVESSTEETETQLECKSCFSSFGFLCFIS